MKSNVWTYAKKIQLTIYLGYFQAPGFFSYGEEVLARCCFLNRLRSPYWLNASQIPYQTNWIEHCRHNIKGDSNSQTHQVEVKLCTGACFSKRPKLFGFEKPSKQFDFHYLWMVKLTKLSTIKRYIEPLVCKTNYNRRIENGLKQFIFGPENSLVALRNGRQDYTKMIFSLWKTSQGIPCALSSAKHKQFHLIWNVWKL